MASGQLGLARRPRHRAGRRLDVASGQGQLSAADAASVRPGARARGAPASSFSADSSRPVHSSAITMSSPHLACMVRRPAPGPRDSRAVATVIPWATCPDSISRPASSPTDSSVHSTSPALRATSIISPTAAQDSLTRPSSSSASDLNIRASIRGSMSVRAPGGLDRPLGGVQPGDELALDVVQERLGAEGLGPRRGRGVTGVLDGDAGSPPCAPARSSLKIAERPNAAWARLATSGSVSGPSISTARRLSSCQRWRSPWSQTALASAEERARRGCSRPGPPRRAPGPTATARAPGG